MFFFFLFSNTITLSAQDGPMGWASLNGGTTGGQGGETVYVSNRAEFIQYAGSQDPYIIMVDGTIDLELYEQVIIWGNKSIIGTGTGADIRYGSLVIRGDNVILQNLAIYGTYDGDWEGETHGNDAIVIYAKNVWVDHCELSASADGLLDISSRPESVSDFITVSWTRFKSHNKVMLIGSWDNSPRDRGHLNTTIYNCWFDGTSERGVNNRMPRVRFGKVHVLNNYYENVGHYCASARVEGKVRVERNYFRNCSDPHTIGDWNIGQVEPELRAIKNIYEVSDDTRTTNGKAFRPKKYYSYSKVGASKVPARVMNGAGLFNPPNNKKPKAKNDRVTINPNTDDFKLIDVIKNDRDSDGGDLRISIIKNKPRGTAYVRNNKIEYLPDFSPFEPDTIVYQIVDTQGGVATGKVFISSAKTSAKVYIPEVEPAQTTPNTLKLYPNPVKDIAYVEYTAQASDGAVEVMLFDNLGKHYRQVIESASVAQFGDTYRYTLNTEGLPPSIYHVVITQNDKSTAQKLVVL